MKKDDYSDLIDQYTEALVNYHEIEFRYNGREYEMEREPDGQYSIWEFEPDATSGTKIATVKTPEEIFRSFFKYQLTDYNKCVIIKKQYKKHPHKA